MFSHVAGSEDFHTFLSVSTSLFSYLKQPHFFCGGDMGGTGEEGKIRINCVCVGGGMGRLWVRFTQFKLLGVVSHSFFRHLSFYILEMFFVMWLQSISYIYCFIEIEQHVRVCNLI